MSHVDPSISSGSSPGVMIALAPSLSRIPAVAEHLGTSPSFVPPESLVVNKRKLPAILRSGVPELHTAGTASESLVVTPNRLWGALHSDVGKQIQHRGKTARILSVHENIRLVVPVGEEEHRALWIPRRAVNRGDFKEERIKRQYAVGIRKAFVAPHWTGQSRPRAEAVTLPPSENLISEGLYRLTKSLGKYENRLIPESSYRDMLSILPPTRHERRLLERKTREKYAALREKLRERLLRQILEGSRLPEEKQLAVYDVLGLGQLIEQAATARKVPPVSLENTVRRITTKVNQAYQAALRQHTDNAKRR